MMSPIEEVKAVIQIARECEEIRARLATAEQERDGALDECRRLRALIWWMLQHQQRHQGVVVELEADPGDEKSAARLAIYVCTVGRSEEEIARAVCEHLAPTLRASGFVAKEPFTVGPADADKEPTP